MYPVFLLPGDLSGKGHHPEIKVVAIRPGSIATEFNEVSINLSGDIMTKTDPDYKSIYQTAGIATGIIDNSVIG